MSRSESEPEPEPEPEPIPVAATAELDPSRYPECPMRVDVKIPASFDPDGIADAVRLEVRTVDE